MNGFLLLLLVLFVSIQNSFGKRTAKEWNEFASKSLPKLQHEDLDDPVITTHKSPSILFATFQHGLTERERLQLGTIWTGQLRAAGVIMQMFSSGEDTPDRWIITSVEPGMVWTYFQEHIHFMPELVKVEDDKLQRVLWNPTITNNKGRTEEEL